MTEKSEPAKRKPAKPPGDEDLVGTWFREERDDAPYPDELTFEADGIYHGKMAPGSRTASKLDVGVFDRIDEKSIRMSTATDRDETFSLDASADRLNLTDEDGTKLAYTRNPDAARTVEERSSDGGAAGDDEIGTDPTREGEWTP
ncbi:hypothetical protein ACLQ2Q_15935 [Microbacterium sp. DT81.1]|uniref:hypothetical protein n=1 Tax=Microbacterium sp. DT81.1 TaxID=3393413 RepID=UPI003CE7D76C